MLPTLFNDTDKLIAYFKPLASTVLNDSGDETNLAAKALYAYGLGVPIRSIVGLIPHITIISGKPTADSHVIQALLRWNKIEYVTIEDMRPIYTYRCKDVIITQDELDANPAAFKLVYSIEQWKAVAPTLPPDILAIVRSPEPIDYRTKVKFSRYGKRPNGEDSTQIEYGIFSWTDAATAGYLDKDNWKKHPRAMLYARAIAIGGRRIADDFLKGLYDKSEIQTDYYSDPYQSTVVDTDAVEVE